MGQGIPIKSVGCGRTGRFYAVGMDGLLYDLKSIQDMTFDFASKTCYITDTHGKVYNLNGNQLSRMTLGDREEWYDCKEEL